MQEQHLHFLLLSANCFASQWNGDGKHLSDTIDIPPEALAVKAWFPTEPGEETVREIKAHIKETGFPYLWRGHTHTKPQPGAVVVYIGEFELPATHKLRSRWSPCPCCAPVSPKFREGRIAWFPEEQVIRIIGSDCFMTLNASGHTEAIVEFRKREQARKDVAYLLANLGKVPKTLKVMRAALPIARAVDDFREQLNQRLNGPLGMRLWDQVRDGTLKRRERRTEVYRRADQTEGTRVIDDLVPHAGLAGYQMLDPRAKSLSRPLNTATETLAKIDFGDGFAAKVALLPADKRKKVAADLGRSLRMAQEVFKRVGELRAFLSRASVATLRTWGARSDCPCPVYVGREGGSFYVGRTQQGQLRITLGAEIDGVLKELPAIGEAGTN